MLLVLPLCALNFRKLYYPEEGNSFLVTQKLMETEHYGLGRDIEEELESSPTPQNHQTLRFALMLSPLSYKKQTDVKP